MPLGSTSKFGAWNLHGGVEFQKLGDTTAFFNGDDDTQVIGSIGIGFWYEVRERERAMLTVGMIVLGLVTFAAMLAFITLCDRV